MRWLRRATDIGLNLPDAMILMKDINKLSRKILAQQPDLQFRCSLVKSTLQLDTIPTEETLRTYSEHLLAELEQLMHRVRPASSTTRTGQPGGGGGAPAVKSPQNEEKEKKGDGPTANKGPCKYFLRESGCRRGQACKWAHQLDKSDKSRRCFTCGATQHMAKDCPQGRRLRRRTQIALPWVRSQEFKLLDQLGPGGTSRSKSGASTSPQAASSPSVIPVGSVRDHIRGSGKTGDSRKSISIWT